MNRAICIRKCSEGGNNSKICVEIEIGSNKILNAKVRVKKVRKLRNSAFVRRNHSKSEYKVEKDYKAEMGTDIVPNFIYPDYIID